MNINEIVKLVNEVISLEKKIETEINKEKNAKKRKKLQKACRRRNLDDIRSMLFDI